MIDWHTHTLDIIQEYYTEWKWAISSQRSISDENRPGQGECDREVAQSSFFMLVGGGDKSES